jgi:bacterial/archaeal transporter family protein
MVGRAARPHDHKARRRHTVSHEPQNERKIRKTRLANHDRCCAANLVNDMLGAHMGTGPESRVNQTSRTGRLPKWLLWSLVTIVLWGTWGLVSKVASAGMDAYVNQLLYTAGLAPLLVFVAWTVHRQSGEDTRGGRAMGIFWAFFTGILGGVGNIFFFQAMVVGGKASVVAPVTALFPMITVLLALIFLHERLGRVQWLGLALAFVAIYLLSA